MTAGASRYRRRFASGSATVLAAASYVAEENLTPFDVLHLVRSGTDPIVTSDAAYDDDSERLPLEPDE